MTWDKEKEKMKRKYKWDVPESRLANSSVNYCESTLKTASVSCLKVFVLNFRDISFYSPTLICKIGR